MTRRLVNALDMDFSKSADIPDDVVERTWRDLCEKSDRTSPVEYPDMALITLDELRAAGRVFVEWEMAEIKRQMDTRLSSYLCDMKPNYDDSITGFNEAWDQMRVVIRSRSTDREE